MACMTRRYQGSLGGWFSNALMFALRRNGWKTIQRTPWTTDGKWKSPSGRVGCWSHLRDSAIILAALAPNPKGLTS